MPRTRLYANDAEKQRAYRAARKKAAEEQEAATLPRSPGIANMAAKRRWNALLDKARTALEAARDDMQSYFDDRSEEWQESDKGQELQERIEAIETALSDLPE